MTNERYKWQKWPSSFSCLKRIICTNFFFGLLKFRDDLLFNEEKHAVLQCRYDAAWYRWNSSAYTIWSACSLFHTSLTRVISQVQAWGNEGKAVFLFQVTLWVQNNTGNWGRWFCSNLRFCGSDGCKKPEIQRYQEAQSRDKHSGLQLSGSSKVLGFSSSFQPPVCSQPETQSWWIKWLGLSTTEDDSEFLSPDLGPAQL